MKKLRLNIVLFAFLMLSTCVLAKTNSWLPVPIQCSRIPPVKGGYPPPHRAPANNNILLKVFVDEENQQLLFIDNSVGIYTFRIYDENGIIINQGKLIFLEEEFISIDLIQSEGAYVLEIDNGNDIFFGSFQLNKVD